MVFGALCKALLSYFRGSSEEQGPAQQRSHQPQPVYKLYQPVTEQPPEQYRPSYKLYQPVTEQPPEQYWPAYNFYQPVTEQLPEQYCWLPIEQFPNRAARYAPTPAWPSPLVNTAEKNHDNEHYQDLRTRAKNEGAEMTRCFDESHAAYARMNGALAKELSNEGKAHQREMERLNAQASDWIFDENNKDREPGEVDLHGLFVKEAITFTERAINDARRRGITKIHLIVGKGLHSSDGVAKLKPAIEELLQKLGLIAEPDQNNSGVLIVNLDGHPSDEALRWQ